MTLSSAVPRRPGSTVVALCGAAIVSYVVATGIVLSTGDRGSALWLIPAVVVLAAVALPVLLFRALARENRARRDEYEQLRARYHAQVDVHDRFLTYMEEINEDNMLPELPDRPDDPEVEQEFDRYMAIIVRVREVYAGQRSAVHASVVSLTRKLQTTAHRVQEEAGRMISRHPNDPDVLETSMRVDHAAAQQARYAQSVSTLCGEWPGQQWHDPLAVSDVVRGAAGRITAYQRVELSGDPGVAVAPRVVEPLIHLIAELLGNAAQSSPPTTNVLVTLRHVQRGAVIEVDDCGVGMDERRLEGAREIVSGKREIDLFSLGELPQTGFAAVGAYVRRYGFRVDLAESVYGGVRATVLVPSELTEPLPPDGAVTGGSQLPLARRSSTSATMPSVPAVPSTPSAAEPSSAGPSAPGPATTGTAATEPAAVETPRDRTAPMAGSKRGTIDHSDRDENIGHPTPHRAAENGGAHDTPLPRRRSRRGEAAPEPPRPGGEAPRGTQPTAEQAAQWMGAFLRTDLPDSRGRSDAAGTGPHPDVYNPEE
ncbi:ATP-binding protein [Saccharomonospora halophila]|uniref:ATP-binding protein n=1 Tax=Saccharomonospora halophila TaxID=129922 RepID=UPI000A06192E|nr:ATP-binding protein [Saccharomonospora halophila]